MVFTTSYIKTKQEVAEARQEANQAGEPNKAQLGEWQRCDAARGASYCQREKYGLS
jgi:hypothetical protein